MNKFKISMLAALALFIVSATTPAAASLKAEGNCNAKFYALPAEANPSGAKARASYPFASGQIAIAAKAASTGEFASARGAPPVAAHTRAEAAAQLAESLA
jgi:hypothetical protein